MLRQTKSFRIGIDLLGSDTQPDLLFDAALSFFQSAHTSSVPVFLGKSSPINSAPFSFISVDEEITMEDDPLLAIRRKKHSSLVLGIQMLKRGEIDAFISSGNTGALFACAAMELPTLPGIDRPALLTLLPTRLNELAVIDVGANISMKVEHFLQFARMGIAYQKSRGVANPRVGLLNIGVEESKGTPQLREAYQKLQSLNFLGNVEPKDVFQGNIDVLVTDGFSGNVFLKTAEGIGIFILDLLEESAATERSASLHLLIEGLKERIHWTEYPGAILCGVEGIVIKCHGDGSPRAFVNSIKSAIQLAEQDFLSKIKSELLSS